MAARNSIRNPPWRHGLGLVEVGGAKYQLELRTCVLWSYSNGLGALVPGKRCLAASLAQMMTSSNPS
jgi:hypothetical protein